MKHLCNIVQILSKGPNASLKVLYMIVNHYDCPSADPQIIATASIVDPSGIAFPDSSLEL